MPFFKEGPVAIVLSELYRAAEGRRGTLVVIYALFFLANTCRLLGPLVTAHLIGVLQVGGEGMLRQAVEASALLLALSVGFWVFHGPARVIERIFAFYVYRQFNAAALSHIFHLPASWHAAHHTGDTISRVEQASTSLKEYASNQFMYIDTLMSFAGALLGVTYLFPVVGLAIIIVTLLGVLVLAQFDRYLVPLNHEQNETKHVFSAARSDYLQNIATVLTLKLQGTARTVLDEKVEAQLPSLQRHAPINEWKWFSAQMFADLVKYGTILAYIAWYGSALDLGVVVALYQYLDRFSNSFYGFASQWQNLITYSTALQAMQPIREAAPMQEGEGKEGSANEIVIQGLTVTHATGGGRSALADISLRIRRGQKIALVGSSGSGKTTLLAVLAGLVRATSGTAAIDGQACEIEKVRHGTTLMPQEVELFDGTILHNITAGRGATEAAVRQALDLACFTDTLERLPGGLLTHIFEKGVNLSGGQKQRLALGRGILAAEQSALILLDEPTSSVDPVTEQLIYANLFEHFSDRTIISSLHRLHLLPLFDQVYVLEHGKVVQEGTPAELMQREDGHVARAMRALQQGSLPA